MQLVTSSRLLPPLLTAVVHTTVAGNTTRGGHDDLFLRRSRSLPVSPLGLTETDLFHFRVRAVLEVRTDSRYLLAVENRH